MLGKVHPMTLSSHLHLTDTHFSHVSPTTSCCSLSVDDDVISCSRSSMRMDGLTAQCAFNEAMDEIRAGSTVQRYLTLPYSLSNEHTKPFLELFAVALRTTISDYQFLGASPPASYPIFTSRAPRLLVPLIRSSATFTTYTSACPLNMVRKRQGG